MPASTKKRIYLIQILVLLSAIFELLSIFSIGPLVQMISDINILKDENQIVTKIYNYFNFNDTKEFLIAMIITLLIIFLLSAFFLITNIYYFLKFSEDFGNILRKELFNYYVFQSWIFHSQNNISNYTKQIAYETSRVAHNVVMSLSLIHI